MSQKSRFAIARAFLLSAEVPGVNCVLSPLLLNDAAPDWALLTAPVFVPQSADSHVANAPVPPAGTEPKAEAFSSAASSCWSACIFPWSSAVRLPPVDFVETDDQKPPMSLPRSSIGRPHRVRSMMPTVAATPGKV